MESMLEILLSYLLGSLNGSLLLGRLSGVDIRTQGSRNAGGTNALRTQGPVFAFGVILIDVLKAWLAVRILPDLVETLGLNLGWVSPWSGRWLPVSCGFAAVIGHIYPVFHGFRGGKGVATLLGVLFALSPFLLFTLIAVWLLMMMIFGFVSLGSIVASISLPFLILFGWRAGLVLDANLVPWFIFSLACALLVCWTHRSNLLRIREGTEPRAQRLWLLGRLLK